MKRHHWALLALSLGIVLLFSAFTLAAFSASGLPDPLLSISPTASMQDVDLGTGVIVAFREPMDHASVEARFTISPTVAGRFEWAKDTLSFLPDDLLVPQTRYQVTLKAGIRTATGRVALNTDFAWAFTTREAWNALNWGSGPPVQLLNPSGNRTLHFQTAYTYNRFTATLQLHRLTESQFASFYRKMNNNPPRNIDPTGLPLIVQWQEVVNRPSSNFPVKTTLPQVAPGFYLISVSHPYAGRDQILVILSSYSLVLKRGTGGQLTVWASQQSALANSADGRTESELSDAQALDQPVRDMNLKIYHKDGSVIREGRTGSDGVFTTTLPGDTSNLVVLGRLPGQVCPEGGECVTAAGTDWNWQTYDYSYWPNPEGVPTERVYIYTDRPIYRPGHTVQFKAILRHDSDAVYTPVQAGQPVSVTLRDPRNNLVATQVLTTTHFGTVDGTFSLADEVSLGDYTLELLLGQNKHTQTFKVEAYRKPEFEVTIATAAPFYFVGDTFTATLQADYYFGQPVASAPASLKVYRRPLSYWWWYGNNLGELILDLKGNTGLDGRWTSVIDISGLAKEDALLTLDATVTDASNLPVMAQRQVRAYWSAYTLALQQDHYGYTPGEPIAVDIAAVDRNGTPAANLALQAALWSSYPNEVIVQKISLTTDSRGQARATFTGVPQGWYRIVVSGTDQRGRSFEATSWAWVYDWTNHWGWKPPESLTVTTDRDQYQPGDTAHLLIQSPVTGTALLVLERDQVRQEFPIALPNTVSTVDVLIRPDFAPNVFARVHIFKNGPPAYAYEYSSQPEAHLLSGGVELKVPVTDRQLNVVVTPDRTTFHPRDTVTFTIQISQWSSEQSTRTVYDPPLSQNWERGPGGEGGSPVEAEVSLALVDEAIFALAEDQSGDPFAAFYGARGDNVVTYDSHRPLRYLWPPYDYEVGPPGRAATATPAPTGTPPVAAPGLEKSANPPRSVFLDTAYWNARIHTDRSGRAVISVPLPDNLTRWRVIARAITLDTHVGESVTNITMTKDIVVRPVLPRFLVQGDTLAIDSIVHNFTPQSLTARATLSTTGLVILGNADPRELPLSPGSSGVARWTAVAGKAGTAEVLCSGATPAGDDAVLLPLPVKPFAVPERESRAGTVDRAITETIDLPFNAVPGASTLEIGLAPSIAASLMDGLDELLGYPYGCVEQTMSKVLPNAMVAQAFQKLGIHSEKLEKELPDMVRVGLQKLYGFQHDNGGWGWWYDDDDNVYQTAYVLFGLTMTRQAGFAVDAGVLDRGFSFLNTHLTSAEDPRIRAYALYVMSVANRGDLAASQALLSERGKLDTFARAALALTLAKEGDPAAAQSLVDDLIASVIDTGATAYWPETPVSDWRYRWQTMSSRAKNTAMALEALTQLRPDAVRTAVELPSQQGEDGASVQLPSQQNNLLSKVARWLMHHRHGKGWRSTQETAFAILALSDYIVATGELSANYAYQVYLNDQLLATGVITPALVTRPIAPIVVNTGDMAAGENRVRIEKQGEGRLYYTLSLRLRLFYDRFEPVKSAGSGMTLERVYQDPVSHMPRTRFAAGDLTEIHLTLTATEEAMYVLLEDPLPAGFEGIPERMNPMGYGDILLPGPRFWWPMYGYNRKEIYDDRVSFFITSLWPGRREFTYLARATRPGLFSALPAEASPMYAPEIWSRSSSAQIEISPEMVVARPSLRGDIDRDCQVTAFDTRQVAGAWGSRWGETGFNPARDLNADGKIDLTDLVLVNSNQAHTCRSGDAPLPGDRVVMRPALRITPSRQEIDLGGVFTATIVIDAAADLGAFELALIFDPAVLEVVRVQPGSFLGSSGSQPVTLGPRIDQQAGRVSLGAYTSPGNHGATGTGELASVVFTGRAMGKSALALTGVQVLDSGGSQQPVQELSGGMAVVRGYRFYLPLVRRMGN